MRTNELLDYLEGMLIECERCYALAKQKNKLQEALQWQERIIVILTIQLKILESER